MMAFDFRNHLHGNHLHRRARCGCISRLFRRFTSLFFLFCQLQTGLSGTGASAKNHNVDPLKYPSIFSVILPPPKQQQQNDSTKQFISQVDLVSKEAVIIGTPTKKKTVVDCNHTKISFLVQSQNELDYLETILPTNKQRDGKEYSFELDTKATIELWSESEIVTSDNSDYDHNDSPQQRLRSRQTKNQTQHQNQNQKRRRQEDQGTNYSKIRNYPCFRDFEGTIQSMKDVVEKAQTIPNLSVTMQDIGDSYVKTQDSSQGYDIWALNITGTGTYYDDTNHLSNKKSEKGILFVMSGLHAREMSPPEIVLRWIEETLVGQYGTNADITSILDHTEIHVVLQSNPDGRVADETRQLSRRKNMNSNGGQFYFCGEDGYGVDLNRNFPFKWGLNSGSSSNPCSAVYRGEYPASEPEVQAIVNYMTQLFPQDQQKENPEDMINVPLSQDTTGLFLDIHSSGEVFYYPWAFEEIPSPNNDDVVVLGTKMAVYNNHELSGHGSADFYTASGVSDDYAYGTLGVPGITFEVGNDFYQDCLYFEANVVQQNIDALTYAARISWKPFQLSKGPDIASISLSPSKRPLSSQDTQLSITVQIEGDIFINDSDISLPSNKDFVARPQPTRSTALLFIDQHPYDIAGDNNNGTTTGLDVSNIMNSQYYSAVGSTDSILVATLDLNVSDLVQQVNEPVIGRHVLYIEGLGRNGYKGPVTAVYFDIESVPVAVETTGAPTTSKPTPAPTTSKPTFPPTDATESPTSEPTLAPTFPPTDSTESPTKNPTTSNDNTSTLSPTLRPTDDSIFDFESSAPSCNHLWKVPICLLVGWGVLESLM